jgi:hypothetical protein
MRGVGCGPQISNGRQRVVDHLVAMATKTASPENTANDLAKSNNAEQRPSDKQNVVASLKIELAAVMK